ncbi:hypothetical protein FH972_024118 [Carpinus fangiana]|uniref:Uncharacterized protein n=1 Tax=Carpinus fangiana TaxID=176857 RepID=A0A5N6KXG5_9ROSI|nr:hypothetical protein FH972_024118 [Carpinus fangiana]
MARAVKDAIRAMFLDISNSKSSIKKVLNPAMEGAGWRVFPARTQRNDEKYGLRIDKGEPVAGKADTVSVKLQINSNASRKTLKDLAKEDPHRVIAEAEVDTKQAATKENLLKLRDKLLDDVDGLDL